MSRILLVDDVAMFRELGSVFLARSGQVELAANAAEAFRCAEARSPRIVIADMHLPDLSGAELCRLLKSDPGDHSPRVILLARPDSARDHADAVRAGSDDVLFKPLERDVLIASVRRLLDSAGPRGLPRARIQRPVEIMARGQRIEGMVRNVSRGGLFVDATLPFAEGEGIEEVSLAFSLENASPLVVPAAQVVWRGASEQGETCAGIRFLEVDARTIAQLDHYVNAHFPRTPSVPA